MKPGNAGGAKGRRKMESGMATPAEDTPSKVPETATQGGEVRARWAWTEPAVWTERMLTALEQGVKGGVWFSLIDKVFSERNLQAAAGKVVANSGAAGVDHVTVTMFEDHWDENLKRLHEEMQN